MTQQVIWNLPVPLVEPALTRDGPPPTLVQFAGGAAPSPRDHARLGAFLADRPDTVLRLYGAHLAGDLDLLRHYSGVARIIVDVPGTPSFDGLRHLRPDLTSLTLGSTDRRRLSLAPLPHFTALRELALVGHQRDLEVVAGLGTLKRLSLISVTLPGLDVFRPLRNLRALELKLGGTKDLSALAHIGRLQYLEVWRVLGLSDLSVVAGLSHLEYLFLQHLARVEELPSLEPCARLRRVHLDRVAIRDLAPIAAAPQLEDLLLLDMPQLELDAFRALLNHPTLRGVTAGVRNESMRARIRALLGLGDVDTYGTQFMFSASQAAV
jgi:hypothetical protein